MNVITLGAAGLLAVGLPFAAPWLRQDPTSTNSAAGALASTSQARALAAAAEVPFELAGLRMDPSRTTIVHEPAVSTLASDTEVSLVQAAEQKDEQAKQIAELQRRVAELQAQLAQRPAPSNADFDAFARSTLESALADARESTARAEVLTRNGRMTAEEARQLRHVAQERVLQTLQLIRLARVELGTLESLGYLDLSERNPRAENDAAMEQLEKARAQQEAGLGLDAVERQRQDLERRMEAFLAGRHPSAKAGEIGGSEFLSLDDVFVGPDGLHDSSADAASASGGSGQTNWKPARGGIVVIDASGSDAEMLQLLREMRDEVRGLRADLKELRPAFAPSRVDAGRFAEPARTTEGAALFDAQGNPLVAARANHLDAPPTPVTPPIAPTPVTPTPIAPPSAASGSASAPSTPPQSDPIGLWEC